jgi:hypothetical protein
MNESRCDFAEPQPLHSSQGIHMNVQVSRQRFDNARIYQGPIPNTIFWSSPHILVLQNYKA